MNRRAYFDEVADRWDGWNREEELVPRLREGLRALGLGPAERVVDLGCGTGVLLGPLLELLGEGGRVLAVDFSRRMIELAAAKREDGRLRLEVAEATALPCAAGEVDRVICFSTWPHFPDPGAVLGEVSRALAPGGWLHVWHLAGRETINAIHRGVGGVIGGDLLPPAAELAEAARRAGFAVLAEVDEPSAYLVTAQKAR